MGVDTKLYLPLQLYAEHIAYSLAKAMGEQPERSSTGKENIFMASKYFRTIGFAPASMWKIEVPQRQGIPHCWPSLHLSHTPFGPCWLLMAGSRAEVISIFRTVAEQLGGLLIWQDWDDKGVLYPSHSNDEQAPYPFDITCAAACSTPQAIIKPEDEERAAYR